MIKVYFLLLLLLYTGPLVLSSSIAESSLVHYFDRRVYSRPPPRDVYFITTTWIGGRGQPDLQAKTRYFYTHSVIQLSGTPNDGPFLVEVTGDGDGWRAIKAINAAPGTPDDSIGEQWEGLRNGMRRDVFKLKGTVTYTNKELFAPNGNGIFVDLWKANSWYDQVKYNCNHFAADIATKLKLPLPDQLTKILDAADKYFEMKNARVNKPLRVLMKADLTIYSADKSYTDFRLRLEDGEVDLESTRTSERLQPLVLEEGGLDNVPEDSDPFESTKRLSSPWDALEPLDACFRDNRLRKRGCVSGDTDAKAKLASTGSSTDLVITRSGGQLYQMFSYTARALEGVGLLALATAPIFILMELVNGEYMAAGFATAGLVLGVAAQLAIAGPVGIIVGAALAVFFSILPGLFAPDKHAPSNNITEIVQFAFFGDKSRTGNEQCNQERKKAGLSQNCTAAYGPNTLAKVFGWETVDAAGFEIEYNDGHWMTIPDIAKQLHIIDRTIPNDGSTAAATVDCGEHRGTDVQDSLGGGRIGFPRPGQIESISKGYDCHPKFALKRDLIVIPEINQTLAAIYPRIISDAGGDCKILSDGPNGIHYPTYNTTVKGRPVAIACNLTAANFPDSIPNIAYNSSSTSSVTQASSTSTPYSFSNSPTSSSNSTSNPPDHSSTYSSAHDTSDGTAGRAYIAPPAPKPFMNLNSTNCGCLSGTSGAMCLPNGTYPASQSGHWGLDPKGVNTLFMPAGSNFSYLALTQFMRGGSVSTPVILKTNQSSSTRTFSDAMAALASQPQSQTPTFSINIPRSVAPPPSACLFSLPNYLGDVVCFGVGGANLTDVYRNKAQSITVRGDASVWMYPQYYGDVAGLQTDTDVPDLQTFSYGTGHDAQGFRNVIKALWINDGPAGG